MAASPRRNDSRANASDGPGGGTNFARAPRTSASTSSIRSGDLKAGFLATSGSNTVTSASRPRKRSTCSSKARTAASVAAGAVLVNDVFALRQDGAAAAVAELGVAVCLMHMQGDPRSMQIAPQYRQLTREIIDFLARRIGACTAVGIERDKIIVDPGFGFGKNDAHNLQLLANLHQLQELGRPILVGLSRKRLLGKLTGKATENRLSAGIAAAVIAVAEGANIVRTHDVGATVDALKIADAVRRSGLDNE